MGAASSASDVLAVEQPSGHTGPCATRGEARQRAILDAALDLIAEVGYDRMSMDGLAARACASKATIYRRWPGKAQVVVEALRRRACPEDIIPPDSGSLRGDLLAALRGRRDALSGEDGSLFLGLLLAARADEELASLLHEQLHGDKSRLACEVVRRAVARGELPATADPQLLLELVPALLLMRIVVLGLPTDDAYLAHLVDDILVPLLSGCPDQQAPTPS